VGGGGLKRWQSRERDLKDVLVAAGLDEVINHTFPPDPLGLQAEATVPLQNPLAEDQARLRRSLVAPGLITALQANVRQGRAGAKLFELGRVFLPASRLAAEERRLGILLTGDVRGGHWSEKRRAADFFDLRGLLSALAERLGVGPLEFAGGRAPELLHPGKSATLLWRGESLGYLGALHPNVQQRAELPQEVFVAELRIDPWLRAEPEAARFRPLARHPAVSRDVSLLCDAQVPAASLQALARQAGGPLLRSVAVADRYEGAPVPRGWVSLLLSLEYQDPTRTLTGEEVDASVAAIQSALREKGAEIRGE
jgi:phenylalanyl-tRNA synthetase beta chain